MVALLVPIHLDAKPVSGSPLPVPKLDGPHFNTSESLEPGMHLRWALPDALTRARTVESQQGTQALFPAVPDLWLIVRFEPDAGASPPKVDLSKGPRLPLDLASKARRPSLRGGVGRKFLGARTKKQASAFNARKLNLSKLSRTAVARTPVAKRPSKGLRPFGGATKKPGASLPGSAIPDSVGPGSGGATLSTKQRRWKAWVLDSRTGQATPLASWQPSQPEDAGSLLTAIGPLPADEAHPGWARFSEAQAEGEPLGVGYYPHIRNRFGFHDDLAGAPGGAGRFSYAVVGWYADHRDDPLYRASNRTELLDRWGLRAGDQPSRRAALTHITKQVADKVAAFVPKSTRIEPSKSKRSLRRSLGPVNQAASLAESLAGTLGPLVPGALAASGPSEIVCHGAVVDVSRVSQPAPSQDELTWEVVAVPSMRKAIAETVKTPEWHQIMTEALLAGQDGKATTLSGLEGIPAALHALDFVGAPGRSRFYAQLTIRARSVFDGVLGKAKIDPHQVFTATEQFSSSFGKRLSAVDKAPGVGSAAAAGLGQASKGSKVPSRVPGKVPDFGLPGRTKTPKARPYEPTKAEVEARQAELAAALAQLVAQAAGQDKAVHPRLLRVLDTRRRAQPGQLAPLVRGSDGASWWLDVESTEAVRALMLATHAGSPVVEAPSLETLHEQPGPRWYRPSAPHVLIEQVDRSYAHGYDGRFEPDGTLRCRLAGDTFTAVDPVVGDRASDNAVPGSVLLHAPAAFSAAKGLPGATAGLLVEALLLDPGSANLLARHWRERHPDAAPSHAEAVEAFEAQALGWMELRDPELSDEERDQTESGLAYVGDEPSPVALAPWREPWLPLFAYVRHAQFAAGVESDYTLGDIEHEIVDPFPDSAAELRSERCFLTGAITKVLEREVGGGTIEVQHGEIHHIPSTLQIERYDQLSLSLTALDDALYDADRRERSGLLRVEALEVVDVFGSRRVWSSAKAMTPNQAAVRDPEQHSAPSFLTELPPRLPCWGRTMCRFTSADDPDTEADVGLGISPICGYLVPDFVEHALEVFDGQGRALGQIVSTRARFVEDPGPALLVARFVPHAWVSPSADPLDTIENGYLRDLVAGVVSHTTNAADNAGPGDLLETALTALLRVIDTVAGTVQKQDKSGDPRVRMLGKTIAVVRARAWLEADPSAHGPKGDQNAVPDFPRLDVHVGASDQPDDGVYGVYVHGATPAEGRFAPVSAEVADKAVLNGLFDAVSVSFGKNRIEHPFITDLAESRFALGPGEHRDLTVLLDLEGGMHLTTGVFPRKKLQVPRAFTDAALARLEPTFHVGPVLALPGRQGLEPLLPYPDLPEYEERWVEEPKPGQLWGEATPPALPNPGALPAARVSLTRGWVRLEPREDD